MRTKKNTVQNNTVETTKTEITQALLPIENVVTEVKTKEETVRVEAKQMKASKPSLEKASAGEKDAAPQIILQYVDGNGQRKTKTFGCSSVRLSEYRDQSLSKTGTKTTLNIAIEATVVEVN